MRTTLSQGFVNGAQQTITVLVAICQHNHVPMHRFLWKAAQHRQTVCVLQDILAKTAVRAMHAQTGSGRLLTEAQHVSNVR